MSRKLVKCYLSI